MATLVRNRDVAIDVLAPQLRRLATGRERREHARAQALVQALGRALALDNEAQACESSFWANFIPLSSCRGPQAAPKFSYRSDIVTRY